MAAEVAYDVPYRAERSRWAWALYFRRDPLGFTRHLAEAGADGAVVPFGRTRLAVLNHPDLARAVLVEHNDRLIKSRGLQLARHLLGNGLLTSEVPHHTQARRLLLPAFHHRQIRRYAETMDALAAETAGAWHDGQAVDVHAAMMELALQIAAETLFGADIGGEVRRVDRAMTTAMGLFDRIANPFAEVLYRLPVPATLRFRRARADLDEIVHRLIARRRAEGGAEAPSALLDLLLAARDADTGATLSDDEVRDEALTLLLAGHETTANALTWTLSLLARHPDAQERLAEEAAAVPDDVAPFDRLARLPFSRQVFAEGMRLYPPAWVIGREVVEPVEMAGYRFSRGDVLTLSPFTLHRDARFWDAPEAFRPERFAPEAKAARDKFAYLPFSFGRRGCIGEQFAWTEGVLVLAALARRWRFETAGPPPALEPSITLRPAGPLHLRLHAR